MQKLLGNSDLKITERRYGHLLPNFMQAEVNRLRFGLGRLFPRQPPSLPDPLPHFAGARETERKRPGPPGFLRAIPASLVAGSTGLEPVASGVTGRRYNRLN